MKAYFSRKDHDTKVRQYLCAVTEEQGNLIFGIIEAPVDPNDHFCMLWAKAGDRITARRKDVMFIYENIEI